MRGWNERAIEAELRIASMPRGVFTMNQCEGSESLSEPYAFDIHGWAEPHHDLREALGESARLRVRVQDAERVFHGVVTHIRTRGTAGPEGRRVVRYELRFASRMWLLSQRVSSRVFERTRVDEVLRAVLEPYFIPFRFLLRERLPERELVVQYEETDLQFVERLMGEAGLLYFFDQPLVDEVDAPDPISKLVELGTQVAGAAIQAGVGALGDAVGGAAGGVVGDAVDHVSDELRAQLTGLGVPREIVVFTDSALFYPATRERGPSFEDLLRGILPPFGDRAVALHARGDWAGPGYRDDYAAVSFEHRAGLAPAIAHFREFDPARPHNILVSERRAEQQEVPELLRGALESVQQGQVPDAGQALRAAESLGEQAAEGLAHAAERAMGGERRSELTVRPFEIYDHHGRFLFTNWAYQAHEPSRMLASARRGVDVSFSETGSPWLSPGHRFHLEDHSVEHLNREYVPTVVAHHLADAEGGQRGNWTYSNRVECVPATVTFVAPMPRRRNVQSCLTATVIGSDEAGVDVDEQGRVLVRFHWDRERETHRSCRVRVMQPWAGVGFGTQLIPRIGTEVVVSFEGGDPDKPIILGGLYNGASPVPFPLPEHRTRSGIATKSPDGESHLWFDDRASKELVHLKSQKDLEVQVVHDRRTTVYHDDALVVRNDRSVEVFHDAKTHLHGQEELHVSGDQSVRVDGNQEVRVQGVAQRDVRGDDRQHVSGSRRIEVKGSAMTSVEGDAIQRVTGNAVRIVGSSEGARSCVTQVEGDLRLAATGATTVAADGTVTVSCGQSAIRMTPDSIVISSDEISLVTPGARIRLTQGKVLVQCDAAAQIVAETALVRASGASLGLSSEASLEGSRVLLNSPTNAEDSIEPESTEPTTIVLVDTESGEPLAGREFRIIRSDGSEMSGALDDEGKAVVDLDEDAEIVFPGLRDVRSGG